MKDKLNGWHIVALALIGALLIGWLVHEGETLGVIITGVLGILGALGYSIAQGAATKELANGNLAEQRKAYAELQKQHAEDMARKDNQMAMERAAFQQQLAQVHGQTVALAAKLPPSEAGEVVTSGLPGDQ